MGNVFSLKDELIGAITFEDLITAIECNCEEYTEETVKDTFREILDSQIQDAEFLLHKKMDLILGWLEGLKREKGL